MSIEMRLTPLLITLRECLDQLQEKDTQGIFAEPVDLDEVSEILHCPRYMCMDSKEYREASEQIVNVLICQL